MSTNTKKKENPTEAAKNQRVMRQLQHRAALLNWIAEMPSPWLPWEVIAWRRRMPQLFGRD